MRNHADIDGFRTRLREFRCRVNITRPQGLRRAVQMCTNSTRGRRAWDLIQTMLLRRTLLPSRMRAKGHKVEGDRTQRNSIFPYLKQRPTHPYFRRTLSRPQGRRRVLFRSILHWALDAHSQIVTGHSNHVIK